MKSLIVTLSLTLATPAFAAEIPKPTPPVLNAGQSYHIRTWNDQNKECGLNWTPIKVLSFSERGDVAEIELLNTKDKTVTWFTVSAVCDAQKLRAEGKK